MSPHLPADPDRYAGSDLDLPDRVAELTQVEFVQHAVAEIAVAIAERDRARATAVTLEQECARLTAEVNRLKRVRGSLRRDIRQLSDGRL